MYIDQCFRNMIAQLWLNWKCIKVMECVKWLPWKLGWKLDWRIKLYCDQYYSWHSKQTEQIITVPEKVLNFVHALHIIVRTKENVHFESIVMQVWNGYYVNIFNSMCLTATRRENYTCISFIQRSRFEFYIVQFVHSDVIFHTKSQLSHVVINRYWRLHKIRW